MPYTYNFESNAVYLETLYASIVSSGFDSSSFYINKNNDIVSVIFNYELSGGEETSLQNVMTSHVENNIVIQIKNKDTLNIKEVEVKENTYKIISFTTYNYEYNIEKNQKFGYIYITYSLEKQDVLVNFKIYDETNNIVLYESSNLETGTGNVIHKIDITNSSFTQDSIVEIQCKVSKNKCFIHNIELIYI